MRWYIDVIIEILSKELRVRYKHLALGYIWSIASPLAYAMLYYLVFGVFLKIRTENFPVFLVCGLFPWQWLTNSILVGPITFFGNASLIKKTIFPRYFIPMVAVLQDLIHFVISIPVIVGFILYFHLELHWRWLWEIPVLIVVQFVLTYSLNLLTATLNLFFRDLERLLQLAMVVMFYLTPVFYSESMIPAEFQQYILWNPFAPLIINWRNVFIGSGLDLNFLAVTGLWSVGLLLVCQTVYTRLQWRFAEIL